MMPGAERARRVTIKLKAPAETVEASRVERSPGWLVATIICTRAEVGHDGIARRVYVGTLERSWPSSRVVQVTSKECET